MRLRLWTLLAIALAWPWILQAAERLFTVTGIVRAKLDDGQLVIEHDEIPGYMAAMTMAFRLASPAEADPLQPGDAVRFRYRVGEKSAVAESFLVTGRSAPPPAAASVRRLRPGDAVPAFHLLDEGGRPFTQEALRDRFTVLTFIFTRCPVPEFCPAMAAKFAALQDLLSRSPATPAPVRLVSVTLDPEFDRPEILTTYGRAVGARPEVWGFATGEKPAITALARAFSVFVERNGVTLDHTLCTALIGPDGRVIELWRGNAWKVEEVHQKILAGHSSQGASSE